MSEEKKRIIIYGCGWSGRQILKYCRANQLLHLIYAFCDRDAERIKEIEGIPVFSPERIIQEKGFVFCITLLSAVQRDSVRKILGGEECYDTVYIPEFWDVLAGLGYVEEKISPFKRIKIKYCGFWENFDREDFFITRILKQKYIVEYSDNPDYVFVSVFGEPYTYLKYEGIRILCDGEAFLPDFNLFDYAFGFDFLSCLGIINEEPVDRYFRYPFAFWGMFFSPSGINGLSYQEAKESLEKKERFCNFVYRHQSLKGKREELLEAVSAYKRVDSAGEYLNNMKNHWSVPYNHKEKLSFFSNYKFTIAAEALQHPGKVTEKIMQAFQGRSIPIYYGDPLVGKTFNDESFICWNGKKDDLERVVDEIRRLDQDDEAYISKLSMRKIRSDDDSFVENLAGDCAKFIYRIFDAKKEDAYQRIRAYYSLDQEMALRKAFLKNN